jgi:hypothetical protein
LCIYLITHINTLTQKAPSKPSVASECLLLFHRELLLRFYLCFYTRANYPGNCQVCLQQCGLKTSLQMVASWGIFDFSSKFNSIFFVSIMGIVLRPHCHSMWTVPCFGNCNMCVNKATSSQILAQEQPPQQSGPLMIRALLPLKGQQHKPGMGLL